MAQREIRVPDIGNFDKVAVVEVLVGPGAAIKVDDPLITLESDKASMDVPAPFAGTVREVKVKAGDKVGKDAVIAVVEVVETAASATPGGDGTSRGEDVPASSAPAAAPAEAAPPVRKSLPSRGESETVTAPAAVSAPIDEAGFAHAYAGPAVRRFARELGADLGKVKGSGRGGRILKEDVEAWVKSALQRAAAGSPGGGGLALPEMPAIDFAKFGEIERVPLGRIKRLTAQNVHRAWVTVPHVTQFDEADITELEEFRQTNAADAQARGFKLTMVSFLVKACVAALKAH
ncbi:MAG: biotin/lipoyl-containing protein, partial [Acidobacteriota bacterium]